MASRYIRRVPLGWTQPVVEDASGFVHLEYRDVPEGEGWAAFAGYDDVAVTPTFASHGALLDYLTHYGDVRTDRPYTESEARDRLREYRARLDG